MAALGIDQDFVSRLHTAEQAGGLGLGVAVWVVARGQQAIRPLDVGRAGAAAESERGVMIGHGGG